MENYGLLPDLRTPEEKARDYVFGANTPLAAEILQPDGQWVAFVPEYEYQNDNGFETYACVTYSALNCLEILTNRKFNERFNASDRFNAKLSGTIPYQGNTLYNVAESIRKKDGRVIQTSWPNKAATTEEWYKAIPEIIVAEGKKDFENYQINYEWVPEPTTAERLKDALKYAPLQIAIYAYDYANIVNGIYQRVEGKAVTHAVSLVGYKEGEYWIIFDHYKGNEFRKLAWDYIIGFPLKYSLTKVKKPMIFKKEKASPHIYAITTDGKKQMVVDMLAFDAMKRLGEFIFEEVDSLAQFPDDGTWVKTSHIIN